jgi:hypothetical protein
MEVEIRQLPYDKRAKAQQALKLYRTSFDQQKRDYERCEPLQPAAARCLCCLCRSAACCLRCLLSAIALSTCASLT